MIRCLFVRHTHHRVAIPFNPAGKDTDYTSIFLPFPTDPVVIPPCWLYCRLFRGAGHFCCLTGCEKWWVGGGCLGVGARMANEVLTWPWLRSR